LLRLRDEYADLDACAADIEADAIHGEPFFHVNVCPVRPAIGISALYHAPGDSERVSPWAWYASSGPVRAARCSRWT
jgi:hypothetical protein